MLSIIYITCNRAQELVGSVLSCEKSVSIEHEFVIIDNGSIDNTEEAITSLAKDKGINIVYKRQNINLGVSGGRNEGFRIAKGDILYFIDDDAQITSKNNVLDIAYDFIKNNKGIMAMGTNCYDTQRKKRLIGIHERKHISTKDGVIRNYIGCSHFIRKSYTKYNYIYPENLFYGAEELFVGLDVFRVGGLVWYYNDFDVLHSPSVKTRQSTEENKRNGHINTFVIKKYYLPIEVRFVSWFLFILRIIRFEKMNIKKVLCDIHCVLERTDWKYERRMKYSSVFDLCIRFGILNVF